MAWLIWHAYTTCEGNWVYTMDDTYIHMAIARNFAEHGIWGMTVHEFSNNSSGPLYTLLLSLWYKFAGPGIYAPLIFNLLCAPACIYILFRNLSRTAEGGIPVFGSSKAINKFSGNINAPDAAVPETRVSLTLKTIVLLMAMGGGSVAVNTLSGMEHVPQLLLNLLFINVCVNIISKENPEPRDYALLALFAMGIGSIRFEGMFLGAAACLPMLLRKRYAAIAVIIIGVGIPVITLGIYSLGQGSMFLPNSVLVKARPFDLSSLEGFFNTTGLFYALHAPNIVVPMALSVIILFIRYRGGRLTFSAGNLYLYFVVALSVSLILTAYPAAHRYQSWLIAFSIVSVWINRHTLATLFVFRNIVFRFAALAIIIFPWAWRTYVSIWLAQGASANIYGQQYQMAKFVKQYYPFNTIAANDIGLICFLNPEVKLFDMFGLATISVARTKMQHPMNAQALDSLARIAGVDISMFYRGWINTDYYRNMYFGGAFYLQNNLVCGSDEVVFFAAKQADQAKLQADLKAFAPQMPANAELVKADTYEDFNKLFPRDESGYQMRQHYKSQLPPKPE